MNQKSYIIFLFILLLPVLVSAKSPYWAEYLNIPDDYAEMPNLLYFVLLPFLGTFAIIWGILTTINIFENYRVNILLSFTFAGTLLYYGVLLAITHYLFAIGGIFGVIAFFVMFFALSSLYSYRKIGTEYGKVKELREKYADITKRKSEIYKDIGSLGKKKAKKEEKLREIEKEIKNLSKALEGLDPSSDAEEYRKILSKYNFLRDREKAHLQDIDKLDEKIEKLRDKILEVGK